MGNHIEGIELLPQKDRGDCVRLWNGRETSVRDNHLTHCRDGIYIELSMKSKIAGNTIERSPREETSKLASSCRKAS